MLEFPEFTIGWVPTSDFGHPDGPKQCRWLRAYWPLYNVHEGARFPATVLVTRDHDDRVACAHSFKLAAGAPTRPGWRRPDPARRRDVCGPRCGKPTRKKTREAPTCTFVERACSPVGRDSLGAADVAVATSWVVRRTRVRPEAAYVRSEGWIPKPVASTPTHRHVRSRPSTGIQEFRKH